MAAGLAHGGVHPAVDVLLEVGEAVLPAFRAFAEPYFSQGKGWTYHTVERHVGFHPGGGTAWFDERLTNEAYLSEVSMAVRRSDMTEPEGQEYVTPKLAQRFINAVGPNGNDKTPVPKVLVPHSEHTPENTLEPFLKHYTTVQEFMIEATMTDLVRTKLKSPIMPILKFQLGDAFKIILMHNERHLKQIERLMSLTVFPKKKLTEARKASLH